MAIDWTPELEERVHGRLRAIHAALAGERTRADAWAAMLGVRPSEAFTRFMTGALAAACSQAEPFIEPGDQGMASASAGLSHGVGVAVALGWALREDDLT